MTDTTDRYCRRSEIEAVQWTGANEAEMAALCSPFDFQTIDPEDRAEDPDQTAAVRTHPHGGWVGLKPGDWVLREAGRYTTASDEEFRETYEPTADRAGLRDRIAEALIAWTYRGKDPEHGGILETVRANAYSRADAVLAVLPDTSRAASTAPLAVGLPLVKGCCPACGTAGLFLGDGGYVTCSLIGCPEPDAASTLLERRMADEAQQQPDTAVHVGGNAEDCPAFHGTNPPYPFICPGPTAEARS